MKRRAATSGKAARQGRLKSTKPRPAARRAPGRLSKVAELERELSEALQRQTATADILRAIAHSPSDLQSVLDTLVESAARLCDATGAFIFQRSGDTYVQAANHGFSRDFEESARQNPIRMDRGSITGRVAIEGRTVHLADVLEDPEYTATQYQTRGHYRTALGVPLLREDNVIGVFLLSRSEVRPFTQEQIELVTTFADQALIAIENTRLFNETGDALARQTATADILKVIASSPDNVQPVFEAIAARSKHLVNALSTTVFTLVDGMMHLQAFSPTNPQADAALQAMFPAPLSRFVWGESILKCEMFRVTDTELESNDLRQLARLRGFRSMLLVPLVRGRTPIGLISVTRAQPGLFAQHHVHLLQTFADQAVIAIGNVRLFDEVQARTRDLQEALQQQTAAADVLQVISLSPGELEPVFQMMLTSAMRLCEASHGVIWLREGDGYRSAALHGPWPESFIEQWRNGAVARPRPDAPVNLAALGNKPTQVEDLTRNPAYLKGDPLPVAAADGAGIRTLLAVPMLKDDECIGVFVLSRREVRLFADKQIDLVANFARQAVIAIENARLLNELRERTAELSQSLDDLRTAQDRLVQTEKLASLGQLTAGIAHEIKNPLNFVNNFSALSIELTDELNDVLKQAALADRQRAEVDELTRLLKDNLGKVVQHGKRADSIVKNMLLHSRQGSGEQQPADVNALVDESLNLAYHGARAENPQFNVTLRRSFDPGVGTIEVFPQEITRVLVNLISNGFYAVNKRKAENGGAGFEPVVSATTHAHGDRIEIRIRDNGTGIPLEVKEKIFNPFFTTKPAGEGTGLGLSMSHDIVVKQHGGRIDVQTEPGAFTEFVVTLPRRRLVQ